MSDDRGQLGINESRALIHIEEDNERQGWAQSLGVREDLLVLTVKIVGNSVPAVRNYLSSRPPLPRTAGRGVGLPFRAGPC